MKVSVHVQAAIRKSKNCTSVASLGRTVEIRSINNSLRATGIGTPSTTLV